MQKIKFLSIFDFKLHLFMIIIGIIFLSFSIIILNIPLIVLFSLDILLFVFALFFRDHVEFDETGIVCKRLKKAINALEWKDIKEIGIKQDFKILRFFRKFYFSANELSDNDINKLVIDNRLNQPIICPYSKKVLVEVKKHFTGDFVQKTNRNNQKDL